MPDTGLGESKICVVYKIYSTILALHAVINLRSSRVSCCQNWLWMIWKFQHLSKPTSFLHVLRERQARFREKKRARSMQPDHMNGEDSGSHEDTGQDPSPFAELQRISAQLTGYYQGLAQGFSADEHQALLRFFLDQLREVFLFTIVLPKLITVSTRLNVQENYVPSNLLSAHSASVELIIPLLLIHCWSHQQSCCFWLSISVAIVKAWEKTPYCVWMADMLVVHPLRPRGYLDGISLYRRWERRHLLAYSAPSLQMRMPSRWL